MGEGRPVGTMFAVLGPARDPFRNNHGVRSSKEERSDTASAVQAQSPALRLSSFAPNRWDFLGACLRETAVMSPNF